MANQNNYPDKITNLVNQRPSRILATDEEFFLTGEKTVVFGTDAREKVEIWLYNPDGTFAAHKNISLFDSSLGLTTILDNTGAYEFLNLNLQQIGNDIGINPGRYGVVANFFRDEVGSEDTYQLYIKEISDDRTELKLAVIRPDETIQKDVFEFVEPSVPPVFAQAVIDQTYGKALEGDPKDILTLNALKIELQSLIDDILVRINYAGAQDALKVIYDILMERTYKRTLDNMAADIENVYVQKIDLQTYVVNALDFTLHEMKQNNEIDFRFEII